MPGPIENNFITAQRRIIKNMMILTNFDPKTDLAYKLDFDNIVSENQNLLTYSEGLINDKANMRIFTKKNEKDFMDLKSLHLLQKGINSLNLTPNDILSKVNNNIEAIEKIKEKININNKKLKLSLENLSGEAYTIFVQNNNLLEQYQKYIIENYTLSSHGPATPLKQNNEHIIKNNQHITQYKVFYKILSDFQKEILDLREGKDRKFRNEVTNHFYFDHAGEIDFSPSLEEDMNFQNTDIYKKYGTSHLRGIFENIVEGGKYIKMGDLENAEICYRNAFDYALYLPNNSLEIINYKQKTTQNLLIFMGDLLERKGNEESNPVQRERYYASAKQAYLNFNALYPKIKTENQNPNQKFYANYRLCEIFMKEGNTTEAQTYLEQAKNALNLMNTKNSKEKKHIGDRINTLKEFAGMLGKSSPSKEQKEYLYKEYKEEMNRKDIIKELNVIDREWYKTSNIAALASDRGTPLFLIPPIAIALTLGTLVAPLLLPSIATVWIAAGAAAIGILATDSALRSISEEYNLITSTPPIPDKKIRALADIDGQIRRACVIKAQPATDILTEKNKLTVGGHTSNVLKLRTEGLDNIKGPKIV